MNRSQRLFLRILLSAILFYLGLTLLYTSVTGGRVADFFTRKQILLCLSVGFGVAWAGSSSASGDS